jgi:hypothetical protein
MKNTTPLVQELLQKFNAETIVTNFTGMFGEALIENIIIYDANDKMLDPKVLDEKGNDFFEDGNFHITARDILTAHSKEILDENVKNWRQNLGCSGKLFLYRTPKNGYFAGVDIRFRKLTVEREHFGFVTVGY